jgi:hypothetical protein
MTTAAAVALLASAGAAGAQGMNERGGGNERGKPGAAMEKSAPAPQAQMKGDEPRQGGGAAQRDGMPKGQTTGQAPQSETPRQGGQMDRQKQPAGAAQRDQDMQKSGTAGQAPDTQKQQRTGAEQKQDRQQRGAEQKQERQEQRTSDDQKQQRNGAAQKQGAGTQTRTETTGRGDAKGASLTTEQRTKIRQVVVSKNIPRVTNVNFSVAVGAVVPRTVRFEAIPVEIVEIYPAWRGYRVVLVGSELVIVDPTSFAIVAVIAV